ncbi:MAG: Uncharacterized protein G01um10148_184 [Parcubacteria group bacterium Gr01-1014_8]|nr:MAG: Uncharacterized protein G01um10148_184 [Parcubacteria group bacterium Gr01-1014_8]
MSLTTKNIATVFVGLGLVLALSFAVVTPAKADMLSDLQAQVQALLAQIAMLSGGTTTGGSCNTFTRTHQMGDSGGEVMWVQQFLNSHGSQVSATGAGSPGNESSYYGAKTKAAVAKWQAANGVAPAAGYWGPITRAKANSMCVSTPGIPGVPGVPVTGNGLKVMLASDSPTNTALVQGQAIAELAKFTFSNPTGSEITVTNLGFKRVGVSSDSTLANVYLFQGKKRITDSAGVSNTAFNFNDPSGIFKVPAGGMVTISVSSDIAASTNGQQVGAQLVSIASSGVLDSSVVLPITGSSLLISSATLATVDFNTTTTPAANTNLTPQNDYPLWQNNVSIGTRAVWLQSFQLRNLGSVGLNDIRNFRLYVDGVQIGATIPNMSAGEASVAWDLSATPLRLETGTRVVKVVADIVGGSSLTAQLSLRRAADARVVDTELAQPILATANGSAFSARTSGLQTIGAAAVSVTKANTSQSSNVAVGASNVKWATFEVRASGEDVKIESLDVQANTSLDRGLDNGKVFVNGVQVGSTKDLTDATDVNFTFGSSFIAKAGAVEIVDIYADAKSTTGAAFSDAHTAAITLGTGSSNAFGQVSLNSVNVPGSDVTANTVTISSSSLTATKYSGYGNQTMIAGTNNARLGSFTLSSGSTEGVNVNTIVVDVSSDEAATITDLRLVNHATGAAIGTAKASPSTSNSFSVNVNIPVSSTLTVDVIGNIKSGSNAGSWIADIDTSTGGTGLSTGNSVTIGSDLSLQTITVGSGSITVTRDPGTPVNSNVVAGLSSVHVGKFDFAAVSSSYTVQELKVKVPADAATSVSQITLKYKNSAGVEQTVSQALALSSGALTHATATFTGLTFFVPENDSADIDVYVDTPTIASGGKSGAAISVLLDGDEGFKAIDSSGASDTTLAGSSTDVNSAASTGYGSKYLKKTVPTLARLSTGYTTNTVANGTGLFRFTMTADAAGSVDWREISFEITTAGTATDSYKTWTLHDVTGTAVQVNDTAVDVSGTTIAVCPGVSCVIGEAQQIGAGSSKTYELRSGAVTGWGSAGDSISINFTEDSNDPITNAAASSLHSGDAFVWSDRSANSHTTTTTDWTNGYLVKDVDNDTRQCQFGTATTCTP